MLSGPLPPSPLPLHPAAWPPATCPRIDLFFQVLSGFQEHPQPAAGQASVLEVSALPPVAEESVYSYPSPLPSGGSLIVSS